MLKDLSALPTDQVEFVRRLLKDLINSLQNKKGVNSGGGNLLPDEDSVLNSLLHPERGDVIITVVPDGGKLQVFISNRRDSSSPFVGMKLEDLRYFPGRRTLDGSRPDPHYGGTGLFITSIQDQELIRNSTLSRADIYSVHFGIGEKAPVSRVSGAGDLSGKSLDECTWAEKWAIYKMNKDMDHRLPQIENELFSVPVVYAKYKQSEKPERIVITPRKYKQNIGQLIRDVYPAGIRTSLRRDYPAEHKKQIENCHVYLRRLVSGLRDKMSGDNGEEYNAYLEDLTGYIEEILETDPELVQF